MAALTTTKDNDMAVLYAPAQSVHSHIPGRSHCTAPLLMGVVFCWPIEVSYIKVIAQLPRFYGNINKPCPWAMPSDLVCCLLP